MSKLFMVPPFPPRHEAVAPAALAAAPAPQMTAEDVDLLLLLVLLPLSPRLNRHL